MVEKWICWIPPINEKFKLNFDGSRIENKSVSRWVIRNANDTIKMVASRHIGLSIIIVECMTY